MGAGWGVQPRASYVAPFVCVHLRTQTSDISVNEPLVGIAFVTAPACPYFLTVTRAHSSWWLFIVWSHKRKPLPGDHLFLCQDAPVAAYPWMGSFEVTSTHQLALPFHISRLLQVLWSLMSEPQIAFLFYFFNWLVLNWVLPFVKYLGEDLTSVCIGPFLIKNKSHSFFNW